MKKRVPIIILIIIMLWVGLIGYDYYRATKGDKPLIVIKEKRIEYPEGGSILICWSLGYKYIKYDITQKQGYEFGGFWIKVTTE